METMLATVCQQRGWQRVGPLQWGWHQRSVGAPVQNASGQTVWLRLTHRPRNQPTNRYWSGFQEAQALPHTIPKPQLRDQWEWTEAEQHWQAQIISLAPSPTCASTPQAPSTLSIPPADWWSALATAHIQLSHVPTTRQACRLDLIERRLHEHFGLTPASLPTIQHWGTIHADCHWANLTAPTLCLLDWEGWGTGPLPHDAAFLWAYSAAHPALQQKVHETFASLLNTPDGRLCQLFAIAELQRMITLHNTHPELAAPLHRLAHQLLV
jgi:hypothetical protein